MSTTEAPSSNFLRTLIREDLASGARQDVRTRFPPEPNGYLHIGHAKSICLNFGLAAEFGGRCHMRFDDTNPEKEEQEYVDSILADVRWLGFDWGEHLYFASDFFPQMYALAEGLIEAGKAYVDDQTVEEIRTNRGTVNEAGRPSPFRDRSVAENLDLFRRMKAGEFPDGSRVLRAKADMAAVNMLMRDPLLYRIRHEHHHRTGDDWCLYPMYDYAHPLEDALEGITHSFCTLEFDNNRELYDWVVRETGVMERYVGGRKAPIQTEFARLSLAYTMMSKRNLLRLVKDGHVAGWDDPRMPTIAGIRRRGVRPEAIRAFAERIGVAKANSTVEQEALEACIRDDLNYVAPRAMAVLDPIELVVEDWPAGQVERLRAPWWPEDVLSVHPERKEESRLLAFSGRAWIEREDFQAEPEKGFKRLAPGREVRLRNGYLITCVGVDHDEAGRVTRLRCTHDPGSRGGVAPDGRKVGATLHWVDQSDGVEVEVRVYDRLFKVEAPGAERDVVEDLNPSSLRTVRAKAEPSLAAAQGGDRFQFERLGYFFADPVDSQAGAPAFNRIVELKSAWGKPAQAAANPVKIKPASAPQPSSPQRSPRTAAHQVVFERLTAGGVAEDDADLLCREPDLVDFFEDAVAAWPNPRLIANWVVNELRAALKGKELSDLPFDGDTLGRLVGLVEAGALNSTAAKAVLATLIAEGGEPAEIVDRLGLRQVSDRGAIAAVVARVVAAFPDKLAAYKGGRTGMAGFFVGQVMKEMGGAANPQLVQELVGEALGG